jgi:intergrase/recombinase
LLQNKKERVANDILSYAKRFRHCLFNADLTEIASMNSGKRRMVMASLSNLAKFLGVYDQWKNTVRRYGIKWIEVGVKDKRMIDRLTKVVDADDVYNWVKQCKMEAPELTDFLDLMALSGMRLEEAVNSYNLIIDLAKKDKLSEYYDAEKQALEHYRFKDLFLRKGKKAFVSFVPKELIERIRDNEPIASRHTVGKRVSKARFSDLREAHASILTRHLSQSEIDFLHGRIGTSVFMQNYFNPALIGDLKERVFKAIKEIETKIS